MNPLKSKTFRQGSVATLITVLGVAIIILINMVVSTMSNRFGLSADLTENKIFAISEDTVTFLENLERDVEIIVTNTEEAFTSASPQAYFIQANEVLKKYDQLSSHISLRYVDVIKDPTLTIRHADLGLASNQILVLSGENKTVVNYIDLFNITSSQYGDQVSSSKAEQTMTSAILNVTSDKKIKVSVLTGHNEIDLSAFTALLTANNYEVVEQNLLTEDIDDDATVAILAAPARDLTEDELKKLDQFLSQDQTLGTTLFYMAAYDQPASADMPNLSAFLAEWLVQVEDSVVFEMNSSRLISPFSIFMALVDYAEPDYSMPTLSKQLYNAVINSRPLRIIQEERGYRTAGTLLQFSSQSGVLPDDPAEDWMPSDADMTGPVPALTLTTELRYVNNEPRRSHVVVAGSAHSFDSSVLGSTSYANSEYFLGLIDTLAEREDAVRIQDKTIGYTTLEMTVNQVYGITLAVVVILPVFLLILGVIVWLRRRHA